MKSCLHYGLIEKYRDRLPVTDHTQVVSLGEGNTPLLRLSNISKQTGKDIELYVKYEGLNPTGSFKDRGMTLAVSKALEQGSQATICASTGNTSAAAAAYSAQAKMKAFVLIPDGKIAMGKLAQAMIYGATIIQIKGNFDEGMRLVKTVVAKEMPVTLVNSTNPYRLQGQKTAAFEVIEALGDAPDYHCLPVGNAGNISAHWIGYCECAPIDGVCATDSCTYCQGHCSFATNTTTTRPKMIGYQASRAAPFMRGEMVDDPKTLATAIRIGHPQSWNQAWAASRESGGWFDECSDEDILKAQKMLASQEGVFCEPASATAIAGVLTDIKNGKIPSGSRIVCTLTGNGLKDPDTALSQSHVKIATIENSVSAVTDILMGHMPATIK